MITGNGSLSLRKMDLENQKTPAIGFLKTKFAHICTAGQTSINLNSLTVPTQLTAVGFTQPTSATLTAANLLFYRNNLTLISSLRGSLVDYLAYTVSSSSVITLLTPAQENEIIIGQIDYNAQTGVKVVDARPINATGTLAANTTDFNVGVPFAVGQYITTQIGGVLVFIDGVLQYRNTGNSSTVLDGNYYEVDAGNGLGTIIRFNTTNSNVLNICVVSNGLLSERPDGSMIASIENIQGQVNNMAAYVADVTGQSTTTVLGAAPTNQDLKAFGDRVITLENKYTTSGVVASTSGTAVASGLVGSSITDTGSSLFNIFASSDNVWTTSTDMSISIPSAGNWMVAYDFCLLWVAGTGTATYNVLMGIADASNNQIDLCLNMAGISGTAATRDTRYSRVFPLTTTGPVVLRTAGVWHLASGSTSTLPAAYIASDNGDTDRGTGRLTAWRIA